MNLIELHVLANAIMVSCLPLNTLRYHPDGSNQVHRKRQSVMMIIRPSPILEAEARVWFHRDQAEIVFCDRQFHG